jgi:hypothetical protein
MADGAARFGSFGCGDNLEAGRGMGIAQKSGTRSWAHSSADQAIEHS